MRPYLFVFLIGSALLAACSTKNPLSRKSTSYTHCDTDHNFCVQYPASLLPPPEEGRDQKDVILSLFSEEHDVRLLVSADQNAENLSFEQIYEQQLTLWKETYDDVDVDASNITEGGFEVSARGEGYHLYARSARFINNGDIISLRMIAGPEMTSNFFTSLKDEVLLYPNK